MCSCSSKSVTKLQNGKSNGRVAVKMCGKPWCLPVFTIQMRHPSKPQQLKHTFDGWYRLVRYVKRMYPLHVPEFPLTLTRITCSYNHSSRRLSHCRLGVVTPPKRERNNNLISTFIYIIYIYTTIFRIGFCCCVHFFWELQNTVGTFWNPRALSEDETRSTTQMPCSDRRRAKSMVRNSVTLILWVVSNG